MLDFIIENWFVIIGVLAIVVIAIMLVIKFTTLPRNEQIKNVKEWLLLAVVSAETELGKGTGEIKLRYVYDLFMVTFPKVAHFIKFETFKVWVEEALDKMKELLVTNKDINKYINQK